jgi:hypothetical protein
MPLQGWEDLVELYLNLSSDPAQRWVFRGGRRASLETTLERSAREFGAPAEKLPLIERGLVRQFARHYYQYAQHIPEADNYLEWLAIMRHYGAPTRLLDVTYSFYVALFFALESPHDFERQDDCYEAALWAVELNALEAQLCSVLRNSPPDVRQRWEQDRSIAKYATFNALFMSEPPTTMVALVSPYRRNERLTIQQGAFLCPGNLQLSFGDNLRAMLPSADNPLSRTFRLTITQAARSEILSHLHDMNMNHATLFPGLEGMAQSLRLRLADDTLLYTPDMQNPLEP